MPIEVTSTKRKIHFIKACVYGDAGMGKTTLCATAPNPIIISAEGGLLSLADKDVPVIEVNGYTDLKAAHKFLKNNDDYDTICIDSLSEIAEQLLAEFKPGEKDPRKAYGRMADIMTDMTKTFRNLPKHVVMTSKQALHKDEYSGKITYVPYMPGQAFTQQVPYYFDLVMCMLVGKKGDDSPRYLQTQPTISHTAKDRSGKLNPKEEPNLGILFDKILKGENK